MCEIQAGKFRTSKKVNIAFCLPNFSTTKVLARKLHVKKYTNSRYYTILSRDLVTALRLDIKLSENFIIGGEGPHEGCSAPFFDVKNYDFKSITDKIVKLE